MRRLRQRASVPIHRDFEQKTFINLHYTVSI